MSDNIETGSTISFEDRINRSFAKGIGGNKRAIDQIIRVAERGETELNNPRNFDEIKPNNDKNVQKMSKPNLKQVDGEELEL